MLVKEAFVMKKALAKIQKTEINTYIDEFVKTEILHRWSGVA